MTLALPAQALSLPLSLSLLIHCVGKANMAGAAPLGQTLVGSTPHPLPSSLDPGLFNPPPPPSRVGQTLVN